MAITPSVVITCEHAGNEVPVHFNHAFQHQEEVLLSHRGWDPGAYHIAEFFAEKFQSNLFACHVTRLLIEANRSLDSVDLYSEYSKGLPQKDKQLLVDEIYRPYRYAVEHHIGLLESPVFHLSIHSFTPVLNGVTRQVDIGLLFDPDRALEDELCTIWRNNLVKALPEKRILLNEPYRGTDDGFTTYLRTKFPDPVYAGIEIEINQKFVDTKEVLRIQGALLSCFPVDLRGH